MDYLALYRRYRPQRFADLVGQDHVSTTLIREIVEGRVAHAYLFAGPRGTGKTTTARLLAKALNCPNRGSDGEPCNRCESCREIAEGVSMDVIEMDAASHNRVEDIREVRVNVGTVASVKGARRVYILDEAHMLSKAAANALLKTLEEPPAHAHFVLATTEPYKLADTIRSRSQRFDFLPVGLELLASHLASISKQEEIQASREGVTAVARHAQGSVRDALSILEQVAALTGGKVEPEGVTRALGLVDETAFGRLAEAIAAGDARAGLQLVSEVAARGSDLRRFVADALGYLRGIFLAHYSPNPEEITDESGSRVDEYRRLTKTLPAADVLRAIDRLGEALVQVREGREERLTVELAVLRLTRPETASDPAALSARLDRLEERQRRAPATPVRVDETPGSAPAAPLGAPTPKPATSVAQPQSEETAPAPVKRSRRSQAATSPPPPRTVSPAPPRSDLNLESVNAVWPQLVAAVRDGVGPRRYAYLRDAAPLAIEDGGLVLGVPAGFHLESIREDIALQQIVADAASELLAGPVHIVYRLGLTETPVEVPIRVPDSLGDPQPANLDPTELVVNLLGGSVISPQPSI